MPCSLFEKEALGNEEERDFDQLEKEAGSFTCLGSQQL